MLYYDRIDLSERIDIVKSNGSKELIIFPYCNFHRGFKFQNSVMVAMVWKCCVILIEMLLLSLLKILMIVV